MAKKKNTTYASPLRYPGGKAFLAPFLTKTIEKNNLKNITYVEPYAGGAGAALELLFSGKVSKIIINDKDKAIYTFWKVAVRDTSRLIKKIQTTRVTLKEWKRQREIYLNRDKAKELDLAFAVFFLNRTNRSGIIEAGPIGGMKQDGEWKLDVRFNKVELIERLKRIQEHSKSIKVSNKDGIDLLNSLKKQKSKKLFIFLDPPYFEKGQSLYLNAYGEKEHKALARCLQGPLLKWVMTYDATSFIKDLYEKDQKIKRFQLFHTAYNLKKGYEYLIHPKHVKIAQKIK